MNDDLISRSALKQVLKSNCKPELCHDYNTGWCEHCCPNNDFEDLINNAPTVEGEILTKEAYSDLCLRASHERPQGDIRWTDKLSVKSNGDIIDFEGRVVGFIFGFLARGDEHE